MGKVLGDRRSRIQVDTSCVAKNGNYNNYRKEFAPHASAAILHLVENYLYLVGGQIGTDDLRVINPIR